MSKLVRAFTAGVTAAILVAGSVAVSPRNTHAQDADSQSAPWASRAAGTLMAQPDSKPPLNVAGCWSGSVDDRRQGTGTGFLYFVQNGKNLVAGTSGQISLSTVTAGGPLSGRVTPRSVFAGHHAYSCNVAFRAREISGDLVGAYNLNKHCAAVKLAGTFDFTFDASGTSCQ